ncbi:MAG: sigma-70 family RNA polymerase sigma factor [Clostridia bacterium]|nr:sigma-70 family RNA polymerase sigma factor [Clostridia bacterium]
MSEEKKLKMILSTGKVELINALFEELYTKYKGLVCFIISKYIKSVDDVVDIAQDVFLDFFNNAKNVNKNIKFYLTSSAKNKALDHLKKYNKITLVDVSDLDLFNNQSVSNDYLFKDTLKVLKDNLKTLEHNILLLHIFSELTFKEISSKLNMKESSVKTLYFRTLKKSRKLLESIPVICQGLKSNNFFKCFIHSVKAKSPILDRIGKQGMYYMKEILSFV